MEGGREKEGAILFCERGASARFPEERRAWEELGSPEWPGLGVLRPTELPNLHGHATLRERLRRDGYLQGSASEWHGAGIKLEENICIKNESASRSLMLEYSI